MAPEAHRAQILPDPDYRPKNVIHPTKTVVPDNFCLIEFLPSQMVEAAEAPQTPFWASWPQGLGYMVETQLRTFIL